MFNIKDNAEGQLKMGVSSTGTTIILNDGEGVKFPEAPFLVVLNKRNSEGQITKYETIEVEALTRDQMTIKTRGYEGTTPTDFSAGDFVSLFILSKHIEDLKTELNRLEIDKLNKTDVANNLNGTQNQILSFDENGNLKEIPFGTQGQSLVMTPDGVPKFDIAKAEVSYLSAKRELGEDIDCSGGPKGYFLGEGIEVINVAGNTTADIGNTENSATFLLKNNNTKHIDNLKFTVEKVGNPTGAILMEIYEMLNHFDGTTKTARTGSNNWVSLKDINGVIGIIKFTAKSSAPYVQYIRIKDKDNGDILFNDNLNKSFQIKTFLFLDKKNIQIEVTSGGGYSNFELKDIYWSTLIDTIIETKNLSFGVNTIVVDTGTLVKISTPDISATNYWTISKDVDGYLSGEYTLGYESGKKYISNPDLPSRSKVDGIEVVGGSVGDATTGIEGGIYELPDGVEYTGDLYVQADGSISTEKTDLYFGVGIGNRIKIQNKDYLIDTAVSSTATTGTVALGNAVGYMRIKGEDGKFYKIPVYNE